MASKIQWTEETWNPIVGCSVVSPGCTNCYAMRRTAPRLSQNPATPHYHGTVKPSKGGYVWTGKIGIAGDTAFLKPLRIKRPTMFFVNSMSDLFHESVTDEVIDRIFAIMALCPQHIFQILTKRSTRMRNYLTARDGMGNPAICKAINQIPARLGNHHGALEMPLPNVWLGVSVEDQTRADERIPDLLATPAAIRFISAEPLLAPVDIGQWLPTCYECGATCGLRLAGPPKVERCTECGEDCGPDTEPAISEGCPKCSGELEPVCPDCAHYMVYQHPDTPNIDWVIVGGESGKGARPMHPDWARDLRDQCAAAATPYFFKQWGEHLGGNAVDHGDSVWFEAASHHTHSRYFQNSDSFDWFDPDKAPDGLAWLKLGTKAAGRMLDGVEHNAMPEARG